MNIVHMPTRKPSAGRVSGISENAFETTEWKLNVIDERAHFWSNFPNRFNVSNH